MKHTVITSIAVFAGVLGLSQAAGVNGKGRRPLATATEGSLLAIDKDGQTGQECPLKHTDVKADIAGFLSRVGIPHRSSNS